MGSCNSWILYDGKGSRLNGIFLSAAEESPAVKAEATSPATTARFLQIARKSCRGANGEPGTCMFNFQVSHLDRKRLVSSAATALN